ncbi:MAG: hypothetical protein A2X80_01110 [Geobacteraceae bacterium GWB2_52_12]|nr:MAG: hypothetical protein A2X80_01110 [Geobacteraceae bacterium GWB2_52_12]
MKSIHVRVSEGEEELLHEKAALLGRTVSDLVRDILFRELEQVLATPPATSGQVEELQARLDSVAETVRGMSLSLEKMAALERRVESLFELKTGQEEIARRVEDAEEEIRSLSENLVRQVELQVEERRVPFGMQRSFVQVSLLAAYTLARGTFSNNREAWEPYKEEARVRAFPTEGSAK